jgi:hypothetical protein
VTAYVALLGRDAVQSGTQVPRSPRKINPYQKKVLVFFVNIMYFNFSFRAELPFGRLSVKTIKMKKVFQFTNCMLGKQSWEGQVT